MESVPKKKNSVTFSSMTFFPLSFSFLSLSLFRSSVFLDLEVTKIHNKKSNPVQWIEFPVLRTELFKRGNSRTERKAKTQDGASSEGSEFLSPFRRFEITLWKPGKKFLSPIFLVPLRHTLKLILCILLAFSLFLPLLFPSASLLPSLLLILALFRSSHFLTNHLDFRSAPCCSSFQTKSQILRFSYQRTNQKVINLISH